MVLAAPGPLLTPLTTDVLSSANGPSTVAMQQRCHRASASARSPSWPPMPRPASMMMMMMMMMVMSFICSFRNKKVYMELGSYFLFLRDFAWGFRAATARPETIQLPIVEQNISSCGIFAADLVNDLKGKFPDATILHKTQHLWIGGFLYIDDLYLIYKVCSMSETCSEKAGM